MQNEERPEKHTSSGSPADHMAAFAAALLDPDVPIPQGIGKGEQPAPKRFSVYRNNVVVSLMEALGQAYPSIKAIMGENNFKRVARNYILAHPPKSAMMQTFGGEFADFLDHFPPLAKSPFLADLARVERAWLDSWHATDFPPMEPTELAAIDPEETMQLILCPLPATTLIRSAHPVADLFDARNAWPATAIDLSKGQSLLITRPHLECIVTELDLATASFADAVFSGVTLGAAISNTMETHEGFDPTSAIATLLQTGALQSMRMQRQKH